MFIHVDVKGVDLSFRPSSRLFPLTAEKLLLSRVKGTQRRESLTAAIEEDRLSDLHPFFTQTSLSAEDRRARAAIHPSFMGGEYLPDFEEGELEVARLSLKSVTADVISVRLRRTQDGFVYRIVDEYMDQYPNGLLDEPTTIVVDQPLTMKDFGAFVVQVSRMDHWCDPESYDTEEEAQDFVVATSEFYPEFGAYIAEAISLNYPKDPVYEDEEKDENEEEFIDEAITEKSQSDRSEEDVV